MERFIGIDLGTTYSAVSTLDTYGKPTVLKNRDGERLTPSAIYFGPDGQVLVGAEAKDMMTNAAGEVAVFFKRFMGDPDFSYIAHGKSYSATDLSAILLRHLKQDAELALGGPVEKAVITVPAYFNDLQRNETVKAAKMAGLDVLRIINEPTAAAITYGVDRQGGCRLLVYDLGGGTFDVTVLEVADGAMNVLATGGDHKLGGKDWDDAIVNYIADLFEKEHGCNPLDDTEALNDLLYSAEIAKKQLSSTTQAVINLRYNGCRGRYTLTRDTFEDITAHLMHSTQQKTEEVLRAAGMRWSQLDGVLLVGGSTKMSIVSRWVEQMSGKPALKGVNVDEAVCIGAGIRAALDVESHARRMGLPAGGAAPKFHLPGGDFKINDVMSHSLGAIAVSSDGTKYVNSIIIPRNKPIPAKAERPFKLNLRRSDQTMDIYLTQGETANVEDCTVIGYYELSNMTMPSDEAVITVMYSYDENGIVNVNAKQSYPPNLQHMTVVKKPLPDDMSWLYGKPKGDARPLCVYIAIDLSGSMEGQRIRSARAAAKQFVAMAELSTARISIVGFADKNREFNSPDNNADKLNRTIDSSLKINGKYGYGNEADPLAFCYKQIKRADPSCKKVIIILTDGYWDYTPCHTAIDCSDKCRQEGIDVIGIGIVGADEKFLKRISTVSAMASLDTLVESFGNIAQELSSTGSASGISLR